MSKEEYYALLCFLVITDDWKEKHPNYLAEKAAMIHDGMNAFSHLDFRNMRKLIGWMRENNLEVPAAWQTEVDAQLSAWRELRKAGFNL